MQLNGTITHGANMHTDKSRSEFHPITGVHGGAVLSSFGGVYPAALLDDAAASEKALGAFQCPANFISGGAVAPLLIAQNAGDAFIQPDIYWAADGQAYNTHFAYPAAAAETAVGNQLLVGAAVPVPTLALGDYSAVTFERLGSNVADTLVGDLAVIGFVFTYLADQ